MASHHMRTLAIEATVALTVIAAAPSAMAASFDGDWSLLVQSPDHCGTTRWNIAIRGGQVYFPQGNALGYPVQMGGRVSPSGAIRVNVAAGPRYASGAGRLGRLQGGGQWAGRGPSGTCAGVWTATRVNTNRATYGAGASGAYEGYPSSGAYYQEYPSSGAYGGYPSSGAYVGYTSSGGGGYVGYPSGGGYVGYTSSGSYGGYPSSGPYVGYRY